MTKARNTNQASEQNLNRTQILQLPETKFKITMINSLRASYKRKRRHHARTDK